MMTEALKQAWPLSIEEARTKMQAIYAEAAFNLRCRYIYERGCSFICGRPTMELIDNVAKRIAFRKS